MGEVVSLYKSWDTCMVDSCTARSAAGERICAVHLAKIPVAERQELDRARERFWAACNPFDRETAAAYASALCNAARAVARSGCPIDDWPPPRCDTELPA